MNALRWALIRWHGWRMVSMYSKDRQRCRYHADRMVDLLKSRG